MPGKILGIEINDKSVTAVQVMSGLKGYNLISCSRINIKENDLEKALHDLSSQIDLKSDTSFVSVSGRDISFRNIKIPFKDPKKIRQTLPFELETLSPFSTDDMIVDFNIINHSDETEIISVAAKKEMVSGYLSKLALVGIDPDAIDVTPIPLVSWLISRENCPENGIYLDIGIEHVIMVLFLDRHIVLVREFFSAPEAASESVNNTEEKGEIFSDDYEKALEFLCEDALRTLHSFVWQKDGSISLKKVFFGGIGALYAGTEGILNRFFDIPAERVNLSGDNRLHMDYNVSRVYKQSLMDNALAASIRDTKKGAGFNLRQGAYRVKKRYLGPRQETRNAAVLLGIFLLILFFNQGTDYYFLRQRYNTSAQMVTERLDKLDPGTKNLPNSMRVKLLEDNRSAQASGLPGMTGREQRVLEILREISVRIPESYDMEVTNMVIDSEAVRITGETDNYPTVDSIESELRKSPLFRSVTIISANQVRSGRIRFELRLARQAD